ncbi:hypothetical protein HDV01_002277 [Terramyces sp. JEL0728]|nr:hypothetical protein HDV01_002277 [Terramyces sp. JEL0728]
MEVHKPLLFLFPEKDSQLTRDAITAIKDLKSFHIITIDKITDQFKKYKSLSPNKEGTELYPDGVISNEWILKHEQHLANVCFFISELYEMKDKDPLGGINMEKDYDLLTIQQINEKRILAHSVGSKFAVLFIIKQDSLQTQERLQNFRKQCHLDKTQVFTYKDQLTFQKPLVELSNTYSKDKEKKIKKKKMGAGTSMNARQVFLTQYDQAIKHYQNSYLNLLEIMIPEPTETQVDLFSKRWRQIFILLDTICARNQPVDALYHLHRHVLHLKDFPCFEAQFFTNYIFTGNMINQMHLVNVQGGGTFGEYVEKLKLPLPYPVPGSTANAALSLLNSVATSGNNWMGNSSGTVFGPYSSVNTLFTVQHSGFYYLFGAKALEDAWIRYNGTLTMQDGVGQPEFIIEKMQEFQSYDFPGSIIELLSKSYEAFKKQKHSRMTLFIASEIARIYSDSHQYDLSIKFYDRISKTYRKELWFGLLGHILAQTYKCARNINDTKTMAECAVELLHPDCGIELPIPEGSFQVDMESITKFLEVDFQFYSGYGQVNNEQKYQIILKMLGKPIQIDEIQVQFNLPEFNSTIMPNGYSDAALGYFKNEAKIPQKGQTVVIESSLSPTTHLHIEARTVLVVSKGLTLIFKLQDKKLRWYQDGKFISISGSRDVRVEQREPQIKFETLVENGYTDQEIPVTFKGKSNETGSAYVVLVMKCVVGDGNKQIDPSCTVDSQIDVGLVAPGQEFQSKTVLKSNKPGIKHFIVTAYTYPGNPETVDLTDTKWLWKESKEKSITVDNIFDVSFEYKQQSCLAIPERYGPGKTTTKLFEWIFSIKLVSTDKVTLKATEIVSDKRCVLLGSGETREMNKNEKESVVYKIQAEVDVFHQATKLDVGQLKINWNKNADCVSLIDLPKPDIPSELLRIHAKPFVIEYTIQNLTLHVAELVTLFEATDNFFYAGYKQKLVRVLPLGTSRIVVNVIAMKSGRGRVPVLRIMKKSDFEKRDGDVTDLSKCFDVGGEKEGLVVYINPLK